MKFDEKPKLEGSTAVNTRVTPSGEALGKIRAVPRKRSLRDAARKLDVRDALGEIIDNAIDNFARQKQNGYQSEQLTVSISFSPDEILIIEDSGGVGPKDLQAFVQVGATGEDVGTPRIGVWGAGQKQAIAALGNDVTISTRNWDERSLYELDDKTTDQVVLRMDEEWWASEEDWDVWVFPPDSDLPTGQTRYEIRALNRRIDDGVIRDLKDHVNKVYGDLLQKNTATVVIDGDEIHGEPFLTTDGLKNLFAYPPGFEPSHHWFQVVWERPERIGDEIQDVLHTLDVEIIGGLTPEAKKKEAGVYMFGVPRAESGAELGPRLFTPEGPLQDESVGYSEGPRSILRKNDPLLGRLRMYVIFHGDSQDIPWGEPGSPIKRGFYTAHPAAEQIRQIIKQVAAPYARFTTVAKKIDVVPHSEEWNHHKDDARWRANLIVDGAKVESTEELKSPEVKPKVETFVKRTFKRPTAFLQWDHRKDPEPPKVAPAFIDEKAKEIAKEIRNRNAALSKMGKEEPETALDMLFDSMGQLTEELPKNDWTSDEDDEPFDDRPQTVSVRLPTSEIIRLREAAETKNNTEALRKAVYFFLEKHKVKSRK